MDKIFYIFMLFFIIFITIGSRKTEAIKKLEGFELDEVELTDPYYKNIFENNVHYLLELNPERLLVGFRAVSDGLDPGEDNLYSEYGVNLYGGWEGDWSLLRGHSLGHYLTSLAQAYKQTQNTNPELNEKIENNLDHTIESLQEIQGKDGYLFASPKEHFDVIEGKVEGDSWVPWYTMHKLVTGLVNVYNNTGNEIALEIAAKLGDWIYARTSEWDEALNRRVLNVEYGGMNDGLYELYQITDKSEHLTAAEKFDENSLFEQIGEGKNVLPNRHANTQIPKFVGALKRYLTLGEGEEFYFEAAEKFWTIVVDHHAYITGGTSENERFREPNQLDSTRNNLNNETCCAYNMLKLTRRLFMLTGKVKFADYYEKTLMNEIMASVHPESGRFTYFSPMGTGYFKVFDTPFDSFWCCTGTSMESYTKLDNSIYFHTEKDLYINLYISSSINWKDKGIILSQEADLPESRQVYFKIKAAPVKKVNLKFRIPEWLAEGQSAVVEINGEKYDASTDGGYLSVDRVWDDGDEIKLTLPMEIQVSRLPDNHNVVAFSYGPTVLSTNLGTEKMKVEGHMASKKATMPEGVEINDYIIIQNDTVDKWIDNIENNLVKTPDKVAFTLKNTEQNDDLKFTPFYSEYKERYGIYYRLAAIDSPEFQNIILDKKNQVRIEAATVDQVQVTNDQHELVHNLKGNSSGGSYGGYNFRHAYGTEDGEGWFSYDMKVVPGEINYLNTKYYTGDSGRTFNIYVDGKLLAEETIEARTPTDFYDVRHKIPSEWTSGKEEVTIKFANRGESYVGGIFDSVDILTSFDDNTELEKVSINGKELKLNDSTYFTTVAEEKTEVLAEFTPASKNALVYLEGILIDDTEPRAINLEGEKTKMELKVVAENRETETNYKLEIGK